MLAGLALSFLIPEGWAEPDLPPVEVIVERAVRRAEWVRDLEPETLFTFDVARTSEKLGKAGETREKEHLVYRSEPWQGFTFERLKTRNGRPLTDKERRDEEKRWQKFRKKVAQGEDPRNEFERNRVFFDRDLVAKFSFSLEGEEVMGELGRAYVLSFEPKSDNLPVRNRMDLALNKSVGKIWIDRELYEIVKVQFRLTEKVKLWWGLIGSISDARGMVEREEVAGGIWMPKRFQIYLNGRILFMSLHRRETIEWDEFEDLPDASQASVPGS
jgi:hypothetical protein